MSKKNLLLFLLSFSTVVNCANEDFDNFKKQITRPLTVGFAMTWLGKFGYKRTDVTNPTTKKIAFVSMLIPTALLYLKNQSEPEAKAVAAVDGRAKEAKENAEGKWHFVKFLGNFFSNSMEMLVGFGAGVLVPVP